MAGMLLYQVLVSRIIQVLIQSLTLTVYLINKKTLLWFRLYRVSFAIS